MAIEMGDRVEGTRLRRPGDNSPLSYHAALSALELSHANQIHNSLSAARTLLNDWLAGNDRLQESPAAPGMCPSDDAAVITARNILKALFDFAH